MTYCLVLIAILIVLLIVFIVVSFHYRSNYSRMVKINESFQKEIDRQREMLLKKRTILDKIKNSPNKRKI